MKAVVQTLEPGIKEKLYTIDGYEFNFILSGSCEYYVNTESVKLDDGDAIYLDGSVPHAAANRSEKNTAVLSVSFMLAR